jgi:hypothetical protein
MDVDAISLGTSCLLHNVTSEKASKHTNTYLSLVDEHDVKSSIEHGHGDATAHSARPHNTHGLDNLPSFHSLSKLFWLVRASFGEKSCAGGGGWLVVGGGVDACVVRWGYGGG